MINNGRKPLVEITSNGRVEHTYDPSKQNIVHSAKGGEDYWITADEIGSLRVLTDGLGNEISIPIYRPFGSSESREMALSPLRFGFGNMWFTEGILFLHAEKRVYRPDLGRYLQRDPLAIFDGVNLYMYVKNSPLDLVDWTGLAEEASSQQRFRLDTDLQEKLVENYLKFVQELREPMSYPSVWGTGWEFASLRPGLNLFNYDPFRLRPFESRVEWFVSQFKGGSIDNSETESSTFASRLNIRTFPWAKTRYFINDQLSFVVQNQLSLGLGYNFPEYSFEFPYRDWYTRFENLGDLKATNMKLELFENMLKLVPGDQPQNFEYQRLIKPFITGIVPKLMPNLANWFNSIGKPPALTYLRLSWDIDLVVLGDFTNEKKVGSGIGGGISISFKYGPPPPYQPPSSKIPWPPPAYRQPLAPQK